MLCFAKSFLRAGQGAVLSGVLVSVPVQAGALFDSVRRRRRVDCHELRTEVCQSRAGADPVFIALDSPLRGNDN